MKLTIFPNRFLGMTEIDKKLDSHAAPLFLLHTQLCELITELSEVKKCINITLTISFLTRDESCKSKLLMKGK